MSNGTSEATAAAASACFDTVVQATLIGTSVDESSFVSEVSVVDPTITQPVKVESPPKLTKRKCSGGKRRRKRAKKLSKAKQEEAQQERESVEGSRVTSKHLRKTQIKQMQVLEYLFHNGGKKFLKNVERRCPTGTRRMGYRMGVRCGHHRNVKK